ncbi:hypothetical protein Vqi01_03060 [Micromonospora qiuiae]|uniref:Uncharacterized protein n=2 Tax=Micromonospora qiuiae TaxID=502268 RepID=A0ABQ4J4Q5_9ACTN|nr:hypothetical protein Vqi01_03060 [Micromonospora qiuiae]
MTSRPPSGYQIRKVHPALGNLQRYTLNKPLTFRCATCRRTNMSTSVVTVSGDWSRLLCNGCYRQQVAPQLRTIPTPSSAKPAGQAQPETHRSASPLPRDMVWLAALHRSIAEGKQLSPSERELHRRRAGEPSSIAAIRYAELLVDVEVRMAQVNGSATAEELAVTREELALRREEAVHAFRAACHARIQQASDGSFKEQVEAAVIREVAPHAFDKAFAKALRRRGMRVDALQPPTADVWMWLQMAEKRAVELPAEVKRLRKLDRADFTREAVAEVNRWECDQAMAHPAVAEQWAECTEEIVTELVRARQSLETDLSGGRGEGVVPRLRRAGEAYARGSTRCLEAQLVVADLRAQASQTHRARNVPKARVDAAAEAQMAVRESDPALARQVDRALEEHRNSCPKRSRGERHADCASLIARVVRSRLQPLDLPGNTQSESRESTARSIAAEETPEPSTGEARAALQQGALELTFICPELRKQVPIEVARVVGVVDISYSDAGRFGFAWVTEHGEVGTGVDRAVNAHDAWLHAACRTVLDLGGELTSVYVICRDQRAVSVLRFVLDKRLVPEALGFAVSERTRDLLRSLIPRPGKVFVSADNCPEPHAGPAAARRLGFAVLRSRRESRGAQTVKLLADQISDELRALAEAAAPQPPQQIGAAQRTLGNTDAGEIRWAIAVGRAQIAGRWCALPDGLTAPPTDRKRIRMRVDHLGEADHARQTESNAEVRRLGDRWELHGVSWPQDLLPGTLIFLRWCPEDELFLASTDLLPRPQRLDDLTYRHRYDIRMVVRENAPGADQESGTPDLSDTGWVLRTLRKLGHLSSDGSATLAEAALVSNCLELGLPAHRASRIPSAVRDLIRDRRVVRVRGSLDRSGLPSFPPRAGQQRAGLLRFTPTVVDLASTQKQRKDGSASRRDHWVDGFVRRLPAGAHASPEQIEAHREAMRAARVVDRPLPDGFTYVRRHRRRTR